MSSAAEILVIILSIVLAIFLLLGITLVIYLIILTHKIRKVAQSAEDTAKNINSIFDNIARVLSPRLIAATIDRIIDRFKPKDKKKKED